MGLEADATRRLRAKPAARLCTAHQQEVEWQI